MVDRIEIDSEVDQTEVADGFLETGHIVVAFEVVRNNLDSVVARIEDIRLLEGCWQ